LRVSFCAKKTHNPLTPVPAICFFSLARTTHAAGEAATLKCSYDYAYGEKGFPPVIPPKSELIFEVPFPPQSIAWSQRRGARALASLSVGPSQEEDEEEEEKEGEEGEEDYK